MAQKVNPPQILDSGLNPVGYSGYNQIEILYDVYGSTGGAGEFLRSGPQGVVWVAGGGGGSQGPTGPQGAKGSTGSNGATGSSGNQGATGPQGSQGPGGVAATFSSTTIAFYNNSNNLSGGDTNLSYNTATTAFKAGTLITNPAAGEVYLGTDSIPYYGIWIGPSGKTTTNPGVNNLIELHASDSVGTDLGGVAFNIHPGKGTGNNSNPTNGFHVWTPIPGAVSGTTPMTENIAFIVEGLGYYRFSGSNYGFFKSYTKITNRDFDVAANVPGTFSEVYGYQSLTTARTFTLPPINTIKDGMIFTVKDFVGSASNTTPIIVAGSGSDKINGVTTQSITTPYGFIEVINSGPTLGWNIIGNAVSSGFTLPHSIFAPANLGTVNLVTNRYNIINPATTIAAVTINLPSSPANNDIVFIKFTQAVGAVTYANGTVLGGLAAPIIGSLTSFTYDSGTTTWY